jgi:hypothetical protein
MIPYDKAISGNPNVLVDTSFDMRRGTERAERVNQTFYHKDLPDEPFFQQTIDGDLPDLTLQEYKECRRSTILSVANGSGKMPVHERTDIEHQGTEPVTDLERRVGATLVDA